MDCKRSKTTSIVLLSVAMASALGCGQAPPGDDGRPAADVAEAASALAAGCEAGPAEPAGTKIGIVTGQIYRAYGNGRPTWTLGQTSLINDIRARLGAGWVRIELRPTCSGSVNDGCEPAGTYESLISTLKGCGLHVLGLLDTPSDQVPNPAPSAIDADVDAWINKAYLPRVEEIVNHYDLDALEVMNEPNVNNKLTPSAFALVVKRTYEHVRNVMGKSSPTIISGGILNLYTKEGYYGAVANSQAFVEYRNLYGRWPLDGFGIHPYQTANWAFNTGDLRGFLLGEMANVRSVIGNLGPVPFWVTEFGWQNTCGCNPPPTSSYCGCVEDRRACDDQVGGYMSSAFSAFRDTSANVAAAFWYDYRDDESDPTPNVTCLDKFGARFGLRKRQPEGYDAKPEWFAFQSIAGGSGAPISPPAAGACDTSLSPRDGWNACIYDGTNMNSYVTSESWPAIDRDWGSGGPAGRSDNFSVEARGTFCFGGASYRFHSISDDGVQLFVDGTRVIDDWSDHPPTEDVSAPLALSGCHALTARYYEHGGGATFKVWWEQLASGSAGPTGVGVYRPSGVWVLDRNRNGWDNDPSITFSVTGDTPVVGDWTGDGHSKPGVFRARDGMWFLDLDGNGWSAGADRQLQFGLNGDVPVVGDWNGTGQTRVGVFRAGTWYFDLNGNGYDSYDRMINWGAPGDTPVVGSWDGSGLTREGVVRVLSDGRMWWYLDMNGNGQDSADRALQFGLRGDVPIVGDWTGTGQTRVGVFRNGAFYLDLNGNGYDGEQPLQLGQAGDTPVVGRWVGGAQSLIGVYRPASGMWYLDRNQNGWDSGDWSLQFGLSTDVPVTGAW